MVAHFGKPFWFFSGLHRCLFLPGLPLVMFPVWVEVIRCEWLAALSAVDVCQKCLNGCGAQPCSPVFVFKMPAVVQVFTQGEIPKLVGKVPCFQCAVVQMIPGQGVGAAAPIPFPSVSSLAPTDFKRSWVSSSKSSVPSCAAKCSN